jgi:hypothetical protein
MGGVGAVIVVVAPDGRVVATGAKVGGANVGVDGVGVDGVAPALAAPSATDAPNPTTASASDNVVLEATISGRTSL